MQKWPARKWDWLAACLLFVLLQVAAARLVTTDWTPFLYFVESLAALGTVLGLALGASRFGRRAAFLLTGLYTIVLVPWRLTTAVTGEHLLDRLTQEGQILLVGLRQFLARKPVADPLLFVLFVCLAFWLISVYSGYWLTRHQGILGALVLSGAAIILVQAYANYQTRGSWWLAVYLLVAIILGGRLHFLNSRRGWSERRVFVNEEAWSNILWSLMITGSVAILAAWLLPTSRASLQNAVDAWKAFSDPIRQRLSNAVTSLRGPYSKPPSNFYGGTLPLGLDAVSGDMVVLQVKVLESAGSSIRYYWRGRAYDTYQNGQWSASGTSAVPFSPADANLPIAGTGGSIEALFGVTSQFQTQTLIYGPSPVVWINRSARIAAVPAGAGSYDVLSWEAVTPVQLGTKYEVRAELINPTIQELRAAGEIYPTWITDHYLEVPDSIRGQLQSIAGAAAAGTDNPYDKSVAVTDYLRANLQYSTSVPEAPRGQDPILWDLLSYKKAFCNYYASAEVLMLRSLGIPARLAVGFARGDLQGDTYTVRRRDAHAWPEVYFPNVGWVEFEPTTSQDPLVRPSSALPGDQGEAIPRDQRDLQRPDEEPPGASTPVIPVAARPFIQTIYGRLLILSLLLVSGLLLVAGVYQLAWWSRIPAKLSLAFEAAGGPAPKWITEWKRWSQSEQIERAFAGINWSLALLGKPQPAAATPAQRARVLSGLLPSVAVEIQVLERELEAGLFTGEAPDLRQARGAAIAILLQAIRARLRRLLRLANSTGA
jgi:transglutaminase-like putative cysteine protease